MVSSNLWRKISIPKFSYGSELWQLKIKDYIELDNVQDIMIRIMQGYYQEHLGQRREEDIVEVF